MNTKQNFPEGLFIFPMVQNKIFELVYFELGLSIPLLKRCSTLSAVQRSSNLPFSPKLEHSRQEIVGKGF